jgi:amino acid permease
MNEQNNVVIRDLTDDELQLVGGGVVGNGGLFGVLVKTLIQSGPIGAVVAVGVIAASSYFD